MYSLSFTLSFSLSSFSPFFMHQRVKVTLNVSIYPAMVDTREAGSRGNTVWVTTSSSLVYLHSMKKIKIPGFHNG
jgi:hypothetical protein